MVYCYLMISHGKTISNYVTILFSFKYTEYNIKYGGCWRNVRAESALTYNFAMNGRASSSVAHLPRSRMWTRSRILTPIPTNRPIWLFNWYTVTSAVVFRLGLLHIYYIGEYWKIREICLDLSTYDVNTPLWLPVVPRECIFVSFLFADLLEIKIVF